MRRRDFTALVGGTVVAWPLAARAQAPPPVIGYLAQGTPEGRTGELVAAVRRGLGEHMRLGQCS
jgi:hypothetical protein